MKQAGNNPPAFLALVPTFDCNAFAEPDALFWPGYFWLWNDTLDEEVIREQLRDMAAHGARSVVMLPMPHAFRPESTNNFMEPDYLTPDFFDRVRVAVEEATRLDMHWWLYDEGGWPSGQALGEVVEGHPELAAHKLKRERVPADVPYPVPEGAFALIVETPRREVFKPGMTWTPDSGEDVAFVYRLEVGETSDLLNPAVGRRFIELTHDRYKNAVGEHFGGTIRLAFTDEPAVTSVRPPDWITWTPGMERLYAEQFGHDIHEDLPLLFAPPHADMPPCGAQTRIDFFDLWTTRFAEAYFMPLRQWCRENGLASAGHLGGEDETLGAIRHGFGHAMRQLRALDLPGVDVIWRQLVPGRPNQHHFPKFASSSAHQNGTRHTFTESFAVYGNGLTPAQMKWLVDYQFVRGIDLLVGACYPFGTREHHMTGERPHFGRCNPLWDHMNGFHAYAARLGYCLSVGTPDISVALYYPVRDLWAWGEEAEDAVASHDGLAAELFAHQCDFDLVDDDALVSASIEDGRLAVGPMRYATIVCGETCWMQAEARSRLQSFADAGGVVLCLRHAPGIAGESDADANSFQVSRTIPELVGQIEPTVFLTPPACDVRVSARRVADGRMLMLFNEGNAGYAGRIRVGSLHVYRLHPSTGGIEKVPDTTQDLPVELGAWESALFLLSDAPLEAASPCPMTEDTLELDATMLAVPHRRFIAGEHDFEILDLAEPATSFDRGAIWCDWLGEDFSGEVEYKVDFDVPDAWAESPLQLETGEIEHAATVFLDGASIGQMAWAPWRLLLPPCSAGHHELVIRVANTLANELTSDRVVKEWATKSGPGWPGVYHKRALEQEEETKGGGLRGPILLRRMRKAGCCGVLHAYP